ncbi:TetR/AcrR family transcriptional regulator [Nocardia sp. alder85J]|uniref:TetR/AcrR family transcriptional regulator n=1 Tax=Nocardia sp. alder85J TaxID=2862949 RepID=UPI001CD6B49A|nr:TetR/AcrR family transcriptional regulator [Nocardia sp. alder85J]MCX4098086.1 helix-turn-helix domain containing protein [Nocardia sp. alder85J]
MTEVSPDQKTDYRHTRAVPVRARSHASREAILHAAMALWRTKGFAGTTVTDICKAAGVSKALFYVYFSRREDVLLELEVFTMRDAHTAAETVTSGPYELTDLIAAVVGTLEQHLRAFPAELIFETVLEIYRLEQRALADNALESDLAPLFLDPFRQAQLDGKLPADVNIPRAARIAQILVADAIRRWAARGLTGEPPTTTAPAEIATLIPAVR